ncbi:MAG: DUF6356 family protein [Marinibacterium sp.]
MTRTIRRIFLDHPASVSESYVEHLVFASRFAFQLFSAAGAALIHAFVPCLFEKTASRAIADMHQRLAHR